MSECESKPLNVKIHTVYPSVRIAFFFLGINCYLVYYLGLGYAMNERNCKNSEGAHKKGIFFMSRKSGDRQFREEAL